MFHSILLVGLVSGQVPPQAPPLAVPQAPPLAVPQAPPLAQKNGCKCGEDCPHGKSCTCGSGCQCPAPTAAKKDPYKLDSYQAALDKVDLGATVLLFVRVQDSAVGGGQFRYQTDGFPHMAAGVYRCYLSGGRRAMEAVGQASQPVGNTRTGGGDHTHACGKCGTVFDHSAAGDPTQSHLCPNCGSGPWPVVASFTNQTQQQIQQPQQFFQQPQQFFQQPQQFFQRPAIQGLRSMVLGQNCGPTG